MKMKKEKKRKLLGFLLIISVLDFVSMVSHIIIFKSKHHEDRSTGLISSTVVVRLSTIAILSYFIIKNIKTYWHHYLSIIILLAVVIILSFYYFYRKEKNNGNYFIKFIILILQNYYFRLCMFVVKILTNE